MTDDKNQRLIRTGRRGWAILYGTWTLAALLIAGTYYMFMAGAAVPQWRWKTVFLEQVLVYNLFASICPLVYRVSFKHPFTRSRWPVTLAVHLLIGVSVVAAFLVICGISDSLTNPGSTSLAHSVTLQFKTPMRLFQGLGTIVFYGIVVGLMTLIRLDLQRKQQDARSKELELRAARLESQLTNARLRTLKMQLHPHFFFNTLNSISALVESKQNDRAFKTIAQLGALLRSALESPDTRTVPLNREMEFIEKYLTIESIRFADRLETTTDIPGECRDARLPALILQPLVENAVRHAVSAQTGTVRIAVTARKENENLVLEVSDDGPGLPTGWTMDTHAGIGLKNVRERLQSLYGDTFGLKIIPSNPKGVTARMIIPYLLKP